MFLTGFEITFRRKSSFAVLTNELVVCWRKKCIQKKWKQYVSFISD